MATDQISRFCRLRILRFD